jgi:hypothetical protein
VHQLFIDFKKAYDLVRRVVLYNILNEFGIHMKLVRLIKMFLNETFSRVQVSEHFLNETFSRVQVSEHLSDILPIKHSLKKGDDLCHCFSAFL